MNTHLSGKEKFDLYYREQFQNRWDIMKQGLIEQHLPILRFAHRNTEVARALFTQHGLSFQPLPWYPYALLWPKEISFGETLPGVSEGLFYVMNASSLIPPLVLASLLGTNPQPHILDACAAPGGKTLVLAEEVPKAILSANELSAERSKRLHATLAHYGHGEITLIKKEAETLFKKMPEAFDAILLDAPCSSEAHVIASEKHLSEWTPNRVKQMQFRQLALLGGLVHALKPSGVLVYSTCSLTPQENEIVVEKFLDKRGDHVELLNAHNFFCDLGTTGFPIVGQAISSQLIRILPDIHHLDPMFIAVFRKKCTTS